MPPRIPDDTRAAILDDIKAGEKSQHAIARDHEVSRNVVRKIADECGIDDRWDRSQTKKANEAHRVDHQARMLAVAGRSIGLAESILDSFEAMTTGDWSRVSPHSRGIVLGIACDKARENGPQDDNGTDSAKSMLGALAAGLQVAYDQLNNQDVPGAGG